ncbi:RHS repeat-associated core domain-containing protein, partial [Ruminiclostridium hungatei]|uniref:RHS repeat-associated core domain-containing protein n=1 Tax=Ruminiclostridium hungatei TaxID=48256 RepID=UPI001055815B
RVRVKAKATITANTENSITINEYDGLNQLVKVTEGSNTYSYTYNWDGLRASKTVNGVTTNHIWDGDQMVLETDGAGNATEKYIRGINLIYSGEGANRRYFLYNGHGDTVQLTSTTGSSIKVYEYDAFGVEKNIDPEDTNLFRYCGEYFDKETGTIYLRARYYNPEIGRFISEDSYWGKDADPLSLNLYTYCGNNPVGLIDPSGHSAVATGPVGLIKKVMETVLNIGKDMYIYDYKFTTAAGAYFLDMRVDKNGIYHANFDCWQSAFGYNNFY